NWNDGGDRFTAAFDDHALLPVSNAVDRVCEFVSGLGGIKRGHSLLSRLDLYNMYNYRPRLPKNARVAHGGAKRCVIRVRATWCRSLGRSISLQSLQRLHECFEEGKASFLSLPGAEWARRTARPRTGSSVSRPFRAGAGPLGRPRPLAWARLSRPV